MSSGGGHTAGWRPGASRHAVECRARLLQDIRAFFLEHKVLEVETPLLSRAGNSDPNIASLGTDELPPRYLRTSPEYALKRMLAAGFGDIYELGRVFRAGEKGHKHNPEFTLLEWYRRDLDYLDLAREACGLIRHCGRGQFDDWPVQFLAYRQAFQQHIGLDPYLADESDLSAAALERGISAVSMERLDWLDLLLDQVLAPALPGEAITVIHDFLPEQAALSRIRQDEPPVAERFEIFLGQMELANGYQELQDATEQLARFEAERKTALLRDGDAAPLDLSLIEALRHGLPECSGVALGVDRLLMALLKLENIDAVLSFGNDRC